MVRKIQKGDPRILDLGKRYMGEYSGRRVSSQRKVKKVRRRIPGRRLDGNSEKRLRLNSIRMVVCLASIPVVIALKLLFPSGAQTVSDYLTGGLITKKLHSTWTCNFRRGKIIEVIRYLIRCI